MGMDRRELANEVFKIAVQDLKGNGTTDKDIWCSIARTDDDSLLRWYGEHREKAD